MATARTVIRLLITLPKWLYASFITALTGQIISTFPLWSHQLSVNHLPDYLPAALIALIAYATMHHRLRFWGTFWHEVNHAVVALLCLNRMVSFNVTDSQGGHTAYLGESNWLIRLAPYLFSLPALTILALSLAVAPEYQITFRQIGVILYALFLVDLFHQARPFQPDIKRSGLIFSFLVIISCNILFFLYLLFSLQGEGSMSGELFMASGREIMENAENGVKWFILRHGPFFIF